VLLPIPGSPPSKTTDPGTIPPPRTRSNSLKPLENLDIFFDEISYDFDKFEHHDFWKILVTKLEKCWNAKFAPK